MSNPYVICFFFTKSHDMYAKRIIEFCKSNNILYHCEEYSQKLIDDAFNKKNKIYSNKFTGVDVKVKFVLKMIKQFYGKNILYLDCTSVIIKKPVFTQLYDMMFPYEKLWDTFGTDYGVNIGVLGIHCNEKTLYFWEQVDELVYKGGWDQGIVNILLGIGNKLIYTDNFSAKAKLNITTRLPSWNFFSKEDIIVVGSFNDILKQNVYIYKLIGDQYFKEKMFHHITTKS